MPNRLMKESICTSESIDGLSDKAEIFFYRLIVQCDDYGRFDGRTSIIRSRCFPLKADTIKDKYIEKYLSELVSAGLIYLYVHDDKRYIAMTGWAKHQQIRSKKSKYPEPDITCNQTISDDIKCPRNPIQSESNTESESIYEDRETSGVKADTKSNIDFQAVVKSWNDIVSDLPKVVSLTEQRKKAIKSIWMKAGDSPLWTFATAFRDVQDSDFLSGRNGQWSGCGFDWVLKPANWTKIIEGNYRNKTGKSHVPPQEDIGHFAPDPDWLTGGDD